MDFFLLTPSPAIPGIAIVSCFYCSEVTYKSIQDLLEVELTLAEAQWFLVVITGTNVFLSYRMLSLGQEMYLQITRMENRRGSSISLLH